jgi:lipopolysaccharide transport system permease protein
MTSPPATIAAPPKPLLTIEPRPGWVPLNLTEIWQFRDLLMGLAGRDVRLRYRQTALGVSWVVLQPLIAAGLLSFVFGLIAGMPKTGELPYFVITYANMLAYNTFSNTLSKAGICLVGNAQLVSKVYFPRMVLPLSTAISTLLDFAVSAVVLVIMLAVFHSRVSLGWGVLLFPVWMAIILILSLGIGLWASALTVSYRDVQYVLPVMIQFAMYASPIAYTLAAVQEKAVRHHMPGLITLYMLNPLSSLLEAFRWSCLGSGEGELHIGWLAYSLAVSVAVFLLGCVAFRRMERRFADVI